MLVDGLIAAALANAGVAALLGTQVYESELPRGYALPAAVIHKYGGNVDTEMDGPVGVRETQVQWDTYGRSAAEARQAAQAIDAMMLPLTGALPDGTIVQLVSLERDMDMPYKTDGDVKGILNRSTLGYRVITTRV